MAISATLLWQECPQDWLSSYYCKILLYNLSETFSQALSEVDKAVRQGLEQTLAADDSQLTGEGCKVCGHLTLRLAASERRAGALARSLDELRDQLTTEKPKA